MKPGTHEEIIIEEDAYPYVFYLASIPSEYIFIDAEGNALNDNYWLIGLRNRDLEVKSMMKLDNFINMMTGHFNNKEQFDNMQREGKTYPYAEHINTICNEKILNLPKDFNGKFVVEESYYETNGKRHASPHLFLITEKEDGIVLYSYEIPEGEDKSTFSYDSMKNADYTELKKSEKFTPALYHEKDGIWEGGSTSQFSPVMTFKLWEKFSDSCLEVSESMEVNGKKTFGYDEPIIYKRV